MRRADPDFVRAATGQVIGGVAPLGHPRPLRTLVDIWLRRYDVVWAAGGHVRTVFPTNFGELATITGGTPADVGGDTGQGGPGSSRSAGARKAAR